MTNKPEVKRYKLEFGHDSAMRKINRMQESEGGVYVRFDDYAALQAEYDQLRVEVEALRKDAERYGLLANMVVADCTGAEMTPQQAALFGSLNAITQIRTTAEFDAVFDAALAGKGGAQ